jgi:hypothetical protein
MDESLGVGQQGALSLEMNLWKKGGLYQDSALAGA